MLNNEHVQTEQVTFELYCIIPLGGITIHLPIILYYNGKGGQHSVCTKSNWCMYRV